MPEFYANLIVRNADIIDGTGRARMRGDMAVRDDRIVGLGEVEPSPGAVEVDARGHVLAPGFVDVHTHDDHALRVDPLMACKVSQGVTTVVTGNCGVSLAPLFIDTRPPAPLDLLTPRPEDFFPTFNDYLSALDRDPAAVNVVGQVGHSSLRVGAMQTLDRPATSGEIQTMRDRLERALRDGAIGLSTGLFYAPAQAAPASEVIELARSLSATGAIHTTHMRDEADGVADALQESFAIGQAAGVAVVISHHKCAGAVNHGRSVETLALIDEARRHQTIGLDVYPYTAGSTVLDAERMMGATRTLVTGSVPHPECAGRDLSEIAEAWGLDIHATIERLRPAGAIYFIMDEADVRRILRYPHSMIGSDGIPGDQHPHPRLWGTFPRVLGQYVRDAGLFSLEEAVRKMTSLPATQFKVNARGVLAVGAYADFVLFDAETIADRATFQQPMLPAAGIERVYVNGRCVWCDGTSTGDRPGKALRAQGSVRTHPATVDKESSL